MVLDWDITVQFIAWLGTIGGGIWKMARLTSVIKENAEDIANLKNKITSLEKETRSNEKQIIELLHNIDKRLSILESFVTVKSEVPK